MGFGGDTAAQYRVDSFPGTPIANAFACKLPGVWVMTNDFACNNTLSFFHVLNDLSQSLMGHLDMQEKRKSDDYSIAVPPCKSEVP